ncbi:MAG TPA: Fe-S protein assembly co-chaperone HscB [Candidatus Thioglobus sp.]|jgi:molecular chaperone HscB|nr:Fe-S protein assembly co-chaperone HscB [Candidatus Thioglobus sp.]HIL20845.1 Fe-S protein assembly co-chaperone HscB [Candidatus Thioglobus sp.]
MQNYFELFDLEATFAIDDQALSHAYQTQVSKFHPDKFASKGSSEQLQALQNTSLINSAYDALKSPLERASYLLTLEGINPFDEKDTQMDVGFLMAQIELRERLEDIKSQQDELGLDDYIGSIQVHIAENVASISQSFAVSDDLQKVKNLVRELKFYSQLKKEANCLMDEWL